MDHFILDFGVTSPLLKTGSLPLSPHVTFWGYPNSHFGVTSFMDGPLLKIKADF